MLTGAAGARHKSTAAVAKPKTPTMSIHQRPNWLMTRGPSNPTRMIPQANAVGWRPIVR